MKRKPAKKRPTIADVKRSQLHLLHAMRKLTDAFHELRLQIQRRDDR